MIVKDLYFLKKNEEVR